MPSSRPCAAFEPISPEFDLNALVESTPNFEYAFRIDSNMIEHHGLASFERLILMHVILGGKPLVIEGYESRLDRWIFAIQWLRDNHGTKVENARDLTKGINVPMTIGHYLKHMPLLTNQWTSTNYKDAERQRMYLKDIDCPPMWHERIKEHMPPVLFYLNESTGDIGGLGAVDEPDSSGSGTRKGRGIAKAGDLMSSLPKEMRAENLMCYIGHEGTYTPAHREMCASLGHNIMVEASTGAIEDGHTTKPGSSVWLMTESKEREVVSEYWLSRLGHDIEVEKHFAQINAWKNAPFKVYVVDQKPGDFILIPPLAPHQVWNRGTRTMKIAWNRTTVETLEMAMSEALPKARIVCRDEQYKNKAIVHYTLVKYSRLLQQADKIKQKNPQSKRVKKADSQIRQLQKDFKRLHTLYTRILISESFYADRNERKVEMVPFEGYITCSYCRCNIFNRFLTCQSCAQDMPDGEQDTYDVCLECYAMGRSCACISRLKWVEQWPWGELVQKHEQWRHQIIQYEGQVSEKSPRSLKHEIDKLGKQRTLAQICQTELLKRPWRDIRKPEPIPDPTEGAEEDVVVDENGNVKKRKIKKKSDKFMRDHGRCHVDCHWEPRWKQAQCTKCQKNYCYGILFRAYDMMPQDIMSNPVWECPSCLNICGCRHCKVKPGYKRYTPKGTLLGHNTKAVADVRSVESLVDFSFSNIQWIQKADDDDDDAENTRRMQKRRRDAAAAMNRDPELDDNYVDENEEQNVEESILRLAEQEGIGIPLDPQLGAAAVNGESGEEDEVDENPEQIAAARLQKKNDDQAQFMLPHGGVVQDMQHAYDPTDAITFVYPEPGMVQLPSAPIEGYQEASAELPYQEAEVPSPGKIEMIERKRKRAKVDEGDTPFHAKVKVPKKSQPKKRQSLVVRLSVNKEKLQMIDKTASAAQTTPEGIAPAPAPVVSSDLQALNVESPNAEGQPPPKRARIEAPLSEDVDQEYAPTRSRDRRKVLTDGSLLAPHPSNNTGRRTTRLQNITYAEPDEDEFNEILPSKSKLATMENANVSDGISDEGTTEESEQEEHVKDQMQGVIGGKRPALTTPAAMTNLSNGMRRDPQMQGVWKPLPVDSGRLNPDRLGTASSSANTALNAQVAANRKAKMALLDMSEIHDIDDMEDAWSPDASAANSPELPDLSDEEPAAPQQPPLQQRPKPQSKPKSKTQPSKATITNTVITNRQSLSATKASATATITTKTPSVPMRSSPKVLANALAQGLKSASAVKASTNDWVDSDSDDDRVSYQPAVATDRSASGFMPLNGKKNQHHASARSVTRGATGRARVRPAKK
ncbi:hypothetical protein H2198_002537 [Neophaeococcomyces mojaviensis]|uniref:Uncharacterized protein n=1 Tax=Neophaeococcomyces mojaviensis TaxID=3383035 RepID=A0ACC3ADT6_9EURO|nr:hypothetical protein H2198_002537 [Knufia sp. JES_112]